MKKMLAPLLLALLAISLTGVTFAHEANDPQRTSGDQNDHDNDERHMDISSSSNEVIVRSRVENGNVENHFGLFFTNSHGVVIHVAFSQESEVGDQETDAFLHLRIAYVNLTEFTDTNDNGLDPGDTIVKTISLQNLTYTALDQMPGTITSQDGKTGFEIRTNSTNGPNGMVFGVIADIFPRYAVIDNTIVPPTATKITTLINGFPFNDPRDKVALQVRAESKMTIEHDNPPNEERIRVRSATAEGFFTISPNATVDGPSVPVQTTFTKTEHLWVINIAFQQGSTIFHDPVLGFDFGPTPILTTSLLIGAAVASLAVFGLLVYLGRRQLARVFSPKAAPQ